MAIQEIVPKKYLHLQIMKIVPLKREAHLNMIEVPKVQNLKIIKKDSLWINKLKIKLINI